MKNSIVKFAHPETDEIIYDRKIVKKLDIHSVEDWIIYLRTHLPYECFVKFEHSDHEINKWIINNLKGYWYAGLAASDGHVFRFSNRNDAVLFELFWCGNYETE